MTSLETTVQIDKGSAAKERLLLVEHSPIYLAVLESSLREVFSGEIDVVHHFDDLEEKLSANRDDYFLALVSSVVPGATDGEALEFVHKSGISTLALVNSSQVDLIARVKTLGIVDYLIKENVGDLDLVRQAVKRLDNNRHTKVLVAASPETLRQSVRYSLEKHLFKVVEVDNPDAALKAVENNPSIRLVIAGFTETEMKNFDFIKKLRLGRDPEDLAIVGIAPKDHNRFAADLIRFGADDFIQTPLDADEFETRVAMNMNKMDMLNELMFRATTDYLTKLPNRMFFMDSAPNLFASAQRGQITIDIAMIDMDRFKRINDTYGHEAGDEILAEVANALKSILRNTDILARMGGEEFCLLAVNVDKDHRESFFNSLREAIATLRFNYGGEDVRVTASMGIASELGSSIEDMINRADKGLYQAKKLGRNQCVFVD
ncbi:diguanylate cyclase [Sneathiella limimaris]|uniref:diguanylate cyclase n=1 Tax=Sneathiella limimaris TaxID=1964213 RepID=UPI00146DF36C|nr:diguanylate cyclase [Sneathiella limimaris]